MKSGLLKKATLSITAVVALMTLVSSCGERLSPGVEFMPNMYRSPSYETYAEVNMYGDSVGSMQARQPVAGTIARGYMPFQYGNSKEEYERAGTEMKNPLAYSDEVLAEGKDLYVKFCLHCHGKKGDGDGMVVTNGGFPPPPSYANGASSRGKMMKDLTPGHIYHTMMYGLNMMGSHASQIRPDDRWKIIYYVQELQGKTPGDAVVAVADSAAVAAPVEVPAVEAPVEEHNGNEH